MLKYLKVFFCELSERLSGCVHIVGELAQIDLTARWVGIRIRWVKVSKRKLLTFIEFRNTDVVILKEAAYTTLDVT